MPYAKEHKARTRTQIVGAAAKLFNRRGFDAVTIGDVMVQAGLTHGGFYRHFASKDELYAEAVRHFLRQEAYPRWQKGRGGAGSPFARLVLDAYLSRDHLDDVAGSCPLIALSSDAARASGAVKAAYREVAEAMIDLFRAELKGREAREHAMVLVALCVGAMVLARALDDEELSNDFLDVSRRHALTAAGWRRRPSRVSRSAVDPPRTVR
jgi:TetR/AcrR family transcriptional regulator, transcriptional repressor for nem operon